MTANRMRILIHRWYLTLPGLLLAVAIAGVTFCIVPPQYTSSGIAMLVPPKSDPGQNSANPLLNFNPSLNLTALVMAQALDTPATAAELGLVEGRDSFTVKNMDENDIDRKAGQPVLYVTARSSSPDRSVSIVTSVFNKARQELSEKQSGLHVSTRNGINLVSVIDATPPRLVPGVRLIMSGISLILALLVLSILVLAFDRIILLRRLRDTEQMGSSPENLPEDNATRTPLLTSTLPSFNDAVLAKNSTSTRVQFSGFEPDVTHRGAPSKTANKNID
jgi:capsular polysaccharide biosynthesis protein